VLKIAWQLSSRVMQCRPLCRPLQHGVCIGIEDCHYCRVGLGGWLILSVAVIMRNILAADIALLKGLDGGVVNFKI